VGESHFYGSVHSSNNSLPRLGYNHETAVDSLISDGSAQAAAPAVSAVFISYASANQKEALRLCDAIEQRGVPCWIACRDVQPGENYQEAIVFAIRSARALVLLFSAAANNSNEIKKELSLVSRFGIPLMALRLDDVEPTDAFAYELATRQWIDLFKGWDRSLDQLVERIGQVSSGPALAESLAGARGGALPVRRVKRSLAERLRLEPRPTRSRRRTLIAGATTMALGLMAVTAWLALGSKPPAKHSLEVRLGDFQRLSENLPTGMPQAMREEISATFANDGLIGVSTASAAPAGTTPAYVLGATARREADKIHVVMRLSNDRTGTMLWSNSFDLPVTQADAVPGKLAIESGSIMHCALFGASTYAGAVPDAVLKDYFSYCDNVGSSTNQPSRGVDFARRVVTALPDFSWGWSAVAYAALGASWDPTPGQRDQMRKIGLDAASTALRLDPANTEALDTKSLLIDPNDLINHEALLRQAIAARPLPCGCEHHYYAYFLQEVGRLDAAVVELRRAIDVLPLDGQAQSQLGQLLLESGHPEVAEAHFKASIDLAGRGNPLAQSYIAAFNAPLTGNWRAALAAAQNCEWKMPDDLRAAMVATYEAMLAGSPAAKSAAAEKLTALPPAKARRSRIPLLAALGAYHASIGWVSSQADDEPMIRDTLYSPVMAPIRADPAFANLAQKLHLIAYWHASHTRPDFCVPKDAPQMCKLI
jgi:tetratricopeptide (TPR) repeat protein